MLGDIKKYFLIVLIYQNTKKNIKIYLSKSKIIAKLIN